MSQGWHHFETWESVPAGMYQTIPLNGASADSSILSYREFLADLPKFESALRQVLKQWPIACEQFLSNANINRIAWLGQSSMCIATGVPACFRAGFSRLEDSQQQAANDMAAKYLAKWLRTGFEKHHGTSRVPMGMSARINHYVSSWTRRGYPKGIPDEVPPELMRLGLAPSQKAIAFAILRNDHHLTSLGYTAPNSPWYQELKRIEIHQRNTKWRALPKPSPRAECPFPSLMDL